MSSRLDELQKRIFSSAAKEVDNELYPEMDKTLQFYGVGQEDFIKAREKEVTDSYDLMDFLDDINRPAHALKSTIYSVIKEDPVTDTLKKGWDAFWHKKDVKKTEDIRRLLSPQGSAALEKKTVMKVLGHDISQADLIDFVGDVGLDPLWFVPLGAIPKAIKTGFNLGTQSIRGSMKALGQEKLLDDSIETATKFYIKKIAIHTNQRAIWKSAHEKDYKNETLGRVYDLFLEHRERAQSFAQREAVKINKVREKNLLFSKNRNMTKKEAIALGDAMPKIADLVNDGMDGIFAIRLGVGVQHHSFSSEEDLQSHPSSFLEQY